MTLPEIAKVLGVSVETVKNRMKEGVLKLGRAGNGQRWAERSYLIKWKAEHLSSGGTKT
jgi:DNA-directed RNA polymerase specialized sigma24 family protein